MLKQFALQLGVASALLFGVMTGHAQTLRGFTYQAVLRDASGNLLANQNVAVFFELRQGNPTGTLVYQETHNSSTNEQGIVNLVIGKGISGGGNFDNIDWGMADYFLGVTINGTSLGSTELESVPLSKVATEMNLDHLKNVNAPAPGLFHVLKWNGTEWVPATDAVNDADSDPANEIQGLSLSGSTLSLSNGGGSVNLPAGTAYTGGTGINVTGNTITNTGDTNAADDITTSTAAGGDLLGTYPNPTVDGIRGVAVAATAPANGQVLKFNGTAWAPASDDTGSGSQWTTSGSNIFYNTGNVGIGDATPASTFTVGNGDKFQVSGSDGDVTFTDTEASIRFPASSASNSPMIYMFSSGTQNADRMVLSQSPSFPLWGLEYKDSLDVFFLRSSFARRFAFELGSGHMGIGVENPDFPLEIRGNQRLSWSGTTSPGTAPGIWFANRNNTFNRAFFGMAEPDSVIGIFSQHLNKWAIEFEIMREPRIGINIPAGSPPRAEVHLYHTNFGGSNDGVRIQNEGPNSHYWNLYTSNSTGDFEFFKTGIKRATINQTSGAYTAVSDARLKTNVSVLGSVLPSVMNLQAKTYQYIDGLDQRYFTGFIAQELKEVFPQFVYYGGDDQVVYTVDYGGMSVVALKAIQEQQEQIEKQQELIEALIQRIEALERKQD